MRVVFMGTPDFAVPSLQALVDEGYEVAAVYTQPDKPVGRKQVLTPPPVKERALELGLPVHQPTKLRDGTVAAQLRGYAPDLIVVVAYGRVLPKEILDIPLMGCVNVHGSLLPKYRGAGPIQWAVINGERETGVTTMYMGEGLDTGDMLLKSATPIGENETAGELFDRLCIIGADCLKATVKGLLAGEITPIPQDDAAATHAPMLDKSLSELDFTKSAQELHDLVRGLNPWPIAHTTYGQKRLKVFATRPVKGSGEPGTVLDAERFVIACGEGALQLLEVQLEGGKRMKAEDFLRGKPIIVGKSLTAMS